MPFHYKKLAAAALLGAHFAVTAPAAPAANLYIQSDSAPASAPAQSKISDDDPDWQDGRDRLLAGDYEVAEKKFSRILKDQPAAVDVLSLRGQARMLQFNFDGAGADAAELLKIDSKHPVALRILGDIAARSGRYEEAIETLQKGAGGPLDLTCRMRISQYQDESGDTEAGLATAKKIADSNTEIATSSAAELFALGRALERIQQFEAASEVYVGLDRRKEFDGAQPLYKQDALVALGNLYQKVYRNVAGRKNGEKEFNEVLKKNGWHFGALVARYRLGRANFGLDDSKALFHTGECYEKALSMDPESPELLLLRVQMFTPDRRFDEARQTIEKVLAKNPRLLEARLEAAALDYLQNRRESYEKAHAEDLEKRPKSSSLPRILGVYLKNLYRFADAIPFLEEAGRRNDKDADALTALGECYAHLAREDDARTTLQKAEDAEPGFVHPWRSNMLEVLNQLESRYLLVRSPNFKFLLHPECEPVLREMLPPFYEFTRADYGERYGYLPPTPVQVEVFRRFDDFSVRSVGFTGFGALGVCFGPLITAVSPLAEEFRGHFSYLDTAWHEYAHVVHLALSKGRVPRWFTEGLATLEEVKRNPAFDRHMEIELLESRATGNIYPIMELNSAFRGPRIIFGYYQGGLICEFLEKKTSTAHFVEALKLFGEDQPLDVVIRKAFGMSVEEMDRGFLEFVDAKLKAVRVRPMLDAKTIQKLRLSLQKNPKDADAARSLAWAYTKRQQIADAEVFLTKLRALLPEDPDAYLIRAELSQLRKRTDVALENYEKGFAAGAEEFYSRMKYADLLAKQKPVDFEKVKLQLRKANEAFPAFAEEEQSPRMALAKLLAGEDKMEESTALLEELCKVSGTATEARKELATRYEGKGDITNLARVLTEMLEVDPFQRGLQKRLATALLQLKQFEDAARTARIAGNVDPAREPQKRQRGGGRQQAPPETENPEAVREADSRDRADCLAIEGEAFWNLNKMDQANQCIQRALKLDPGCERALEVQQKLSGAGAKK